MSKETTLKKEFKVSDVQRMRNIITKRYGDATQTQVGYTKTYVKRNEGDVWEENGKSWTIENGIKTTINKLNKAKSYSFIPLLCPECNSPMKTDYDKKMFKIHQQCFNCVLKFESQLKIEGRYQEYENNVIKRNALFMLDEFEKGFDDFLDSFDSQGFVTEQGDIEDWHVKALNKQKIREEVLKDIADSRANLSL